MMKKYEKMKDSGVEWIRDIPVNWGIRALSQLSEHVRNKNKDLAEKNLLSLSYGKIKRKDISSSEGLLPESFDGYNIIETNDIVLRLTDLQNDHTSLRVGQAEERGIITSAYTTLRPSAFVNPKYLYYVIHSYDLVKGFYGMGSGVRQGLNYDEVKTIKVPFPQNDEQAAIVAYLDDRCAQIDAIIAEVKDSVEEYKQWKKSVVFEAVTEGLDKSAKLRDSGVEWVEKIPQHWRTLSLKFLCTMQAGKNITSNDITEKGEYPVYGGNGLRGYYDKYNRNGNYLLVGRQGALCGNVHRVSGKFWATEHAVVTYPTDRAEQIYLYYLLISMDLNQYASAVAAQPGISVNIIQNVKTIVPPLTEQKQIAAFLDDKCTTIDELNAEKKALIVDLESYKSSLIFETVTGKRKVV